MFTDDEDIGHGGSPHEHLDPEQVGYEAVAGSARPLRAVMLRHVCSVHIGPPCELGRRFADASVEVTAVWLEETAESVRHAPEMDVARYLRALAREIRLH